MQIFEPEKKIIGNYLFPSTSFGTACRKLKLENGPGPAMSLWFKTNAQPAFVIKIGLAVAKPGVYHDHELMAA